MILSVSNTEKHAGYVKHRLYSKGQLFHTIHEIYIPLQGGRLVAVELSDNATTFVRNLQRNFD